MREKEAMKYIRRMGLEKCHNAVKRAGENGEVSMKTEMEIFLTAQGLVKNCVAKYGKIAKCSLEHGKIEYCYVAEKISVSYFAMSIRWNLRRNKGEAD